jgi:carboxyl-terminal processing protease
MNVKIVLFAAASLLQATLLSAGEKMSGQIATNVGRLLELNHYSGWKLGPEISERILESYLEDLDADKDFLTQGDVNRLRARYGTEMGKAVLLGDLGPAEAVYDVFKGRVEERIAKLRPLIWKDYHFTSNRFVDLDRRKKRWPVNIHEADSLWSNRIEGELLQEKLNKLAAGAARKFVARKYNELLKSVEDRGEDDIDEIFLNAVAESYDPHSEYMGHANLESFEINMRLSLVGIGAEMGFDDGYVKIQRLVPGGPAARGGKLSVGDRILGIAQGEARFVDTSSMTPDKVLELIRGKKGSVVRLKVLPAGAADPSKLRVVALVRDNVKLIDEEAKAEIIDKVLRDGSVRRLGYITLPSFYGDTGIFGLGKSASRDVATLLKRLNREKIQGLIVDVRSNGGGSLDEAVKMSGLFIDQGPVVQIRDNDGDVDVLNNHQGKALYKGPMVVLVDKLTASASEIFAATMQDYGRALIVGDSSTFGKGTVQTILGLGRSMPQFSSSSAAGALKLTVQKFYRVTGRSTQLRGIISDVKLPSVTDNAEYGESALNYPLEYDEIEPVPLDLAANRRELFIDKLRRRSAARVRRDPQFQDIAKRAQELSEELKNNRLSLNETTRRSEMARDTRQREKEEAEARNAERADPSKTYELNLAYVKKPQLPLLEKTLTMTKLASRSYSPVEVALDESEEQDPAKNTTPKREALNILSDLIEFSESSRTDQGWPAQRSHTHSRAVRKDVLRAATVVW